MSITNSPEEAYIYARDVLRGPFPAGEAAIASSPEHAYLYARFILKAPWPLGEPIIATSGYAFEYAVEVLGAPFPAGEKAIRSNLHIAAIYDQTFPARPATPACQHVWVNVGFSSIVMACKYCGIDQA